MIGKSILRRIHPMKDLTGVTLTEFMEGIQGELWGLLGKAGHGSKGIQEGVYRGSA